MDSGNLAGAIPDSIPDELVTVLARAEHVRIERIVSRGHASPPAFWYDQDEAEFVLLVAGEARLLIEGEPELTLGPGDWLTIAPHLRHRVTWTDPARDTVWLAVFYRSEAS